MHILILITTFLMLFAIISATRFEAFLTASGVRHAYESYMESHEHEFYNAQEKKKYDKPPARKSGSLGPEAKMRAKGRAKLNVQPLFDPKKMADHSYFKAVRITLIRLIQVLYGGKKFFKDVDATHLVDQIIENGRKEICGKKLDSVANMIKIDFDQSKTREIFYLMLKGGDEEVMGTESYPSLLKFLTWQSGEVPIRIYLARKPLLLALFETPDAVEEVMKSRREAFHTFKLSPKAIQQYATQDIDEDGSEIDIQLDPEDQGAIAGASESFRAQPVHLRRHSDLPESFFDFTVSGSEPPTS